jgi:hypothetical protein
MTSHRSPVLVAGVTVVTLLALTGCGSSGSSTSSSTTPSAKVDGLTVPTPSADPADFTTTVDNPYYPLRPGTVWTYTSTGDEGAQKDLVTVTDQTKVVQGVTTVVVHDVVRDAGGTMVEDTYDWYAQDKAGNVWYFGEDTTAYEKGKADKEGSWEAGKDGAHAGIAMLAQPDIGDGYAQEYRKGVAEDHGTIESLTEKRTEPFGSYDALLQTKDTTPLEPKLVESKYYAKGIGVVHEETVAGGKESVELVDFHRP